MAVLCLKLNQITHFLGKIGNCMAVLCLKSNQSMGIIHFLEKIRQLYGSTESKDLPTNQIRVLYDINVDENLPTKEKIS